MADRAGIRSSAIGYYQESGLLPTLDRAEDPGQYTSAVLVSLGVIDVAKRAGFELAEIRTLLSLISEDSTPIPIGASRLDPRLPVLEALVAQVTEIRRTLELGLESERLSIDDCAMLVAHIGRHLDAGPGGT